MKGTALTSLFRDVQQGFFIDRPNRFIVDCEIAGKIVKAYLPNPGRMLELLFRGVKLFLIPNGSEQKTRFTVVAVERETRPIMVHTQATNEAAACLLLAGRLPGLEDAVVVRREVTVGSHRFDFLLSKGGEPYYLEVKSCTLFEGPIAMFPDAVTERGRRHLEALADLSRDGTACGVLFLVHWPQADIFLPDYHTDLAFAQTFYRVRDLLDIYPVAIDWQPDLSFGTVSKPLTVPWKFLENEIQDGGSYIIIMELEQDETIVIGSLGAIQFKQGYYLYVGTAKKNLTRRVERHLRKRKRYHWHIDYLRERAHNCKALPIRSSVLL